ncbi:kelch repeat protein [Biscogniauxia mediterranea]|nr:kelch repeat protein [Biscogniauxia mediterranea]
MTQVSATWTRLASSARLQRSSQCLSVLGSRAWIFGGELLPRQPVDNQLDVIDLDPAQEPDAVATTLAAPANAPAPRVGAATAVLEDSFYMFSGRGGMSMLPIEENGAVWSYTPSQSAWNRIAPADPSAPHPAGRSYHAMTSDGRDTLYVHAGCPNEGRLADLWSFSVVSKTWAELPAAPLPARGGTSIAFSGDSLYRMNGFDGKTEQGGKLDVYNLQTRSWSSISFNPDGQEGPEPRSVSSLSAVNIKGSEYLVTMFGERDPSSLGHAGAGKMLADVWVFDIKNEKWAKVEPIGEAPAPRGWFDADVMYSQSGDCSIIVHGGLAEDNSRLGDVWKLQFA